MISRAFPSLLTILTLTIMALFTPATGAEPVRVKVMTYNIRHCRGWDNAVNVARIAAVINRANPDIISLQEVDRNVERSGNVDQAAVLANLTGMHYEFGRAIDFQGGEYGQAILSRWPIDDFHVELLPSAPSREQRIGVVAEIGGDLDRPTILFSGAHFDHVDESWRLSQAVRLISAVRSYGEDVMIISGDLNAEPQSSTMNLFNAGWIDLLPANAFTIPALIPNRKIDYILLPRRNSWQVVRAEVLNEPLASDHRPVLVELEWQGGSTFSIY